MVKVFLETSRAPLAPLLTVPKFVISTVPLLMVIFTKVPKTLGFPLVTLASPEFVFVIVPPFMMKLFIRKIQPLLLSPLICPLLFRDTFPLLRIKSLGA